MSARRKWLEEAAALPKRCSQCGQKWTARACGPTHASVAAARKRARQLKLTPPTQPNSDSKKVTP